MCRHLEIAESTWHRWLAQYGGMKANDAKRLKELEGENARLKKLLAEAELDKSTCCGRSRRETSDPEPQAQRRRRCCATGSGSPNDEPAEWSGSTARRSASTRHRSPTTRPSCATWLREFSTRSTAVGMATCRQGGPPGRLDGEQQADPAAVA